MANTYYDSRLTAAEIEEVLEAINGILNPANNGKVLAISNGKFEARSVQWGGSAVLEPLNVTANGDYTPGSGVDGFDEVHVSVPNSYTASDEGKVVNNGTLISQTARASQITHNGTYDTTLNNEVIVNVSGSQSNNVIWSNDGTLGAEIDTTNNRTIWYFRGFTKTSSDVPIPSEMGLSQSGLLYSKAYDKDTITQIGNIGFYNGNIRSWNISTSQTLAGTFWGVVYSDGGSGQTHAYTIPGSSRPILLEKLYVSQNGVILPNAGYDGFGTVTVNVSGGGGGSYFCNEDNTLGCLIEQKDGDLYETWYFNGFTKNSSDVVVPTMIRGLQPTGLLLSYAYTDPDAPYNACIGFYNGNIRSWDSALSYIMGGTFYAKLILKYRDTYDPNTPLVVINNTNVQATTYTPYTPSSA